MRVALVQFTAWDKPYAFNPLDLMAEAGDLVVVTTEYGVEMGKIVAFEEFSKEQEAELGEIRPVDRLATADDLRTASENNKNGRKEEAMEYARRIAHNFNLEMKIVDGYFSFDDRRLILAFIADGRVDFRDLVKELTRHFQKLVRLHQLGVRDEAKISGDVGSCGLGLCCRGHLKKLGSVTSELAEQQQVAHRGSERLSGVCGRLKCCLAYEKELYEGIIKKLPAVGTRVKTKHGRGEVIGWRVLRGSVDVKIDPEKSGDRPIIVEVPVIKD
ncbi:MAG: regulatory iron-sulfur-containing complex subunit RicT [Patescibacteria group bacterium]